MGSSGKRGEGQGEGRNREAGSRGSKEGEGDGWKRMDGGLQEARGKEMVLWQRAGPTDQQRVEMRKE